MRKFSKKIKTLAVAGSLAVSVLGGAVATAPAANAAVQGHCNNGATRSWPGGYMVMPATSYEGSVLCWMDYGSTGLGVWYLQRDLKQCYGANIAVDEVFGSATRAALIAAQKKEGITADGLYGEQSAMYLKHQLVIGGKIAGCGSRR
ncbi:peptidoglycan-binding domain-containing protein [Streptomyces phaeochromogenes]|uniref:peptidoglycan-binding domain-containing protein n=1 Tax=Streptomyces phaeochromogenes TaxID=1923 RepID=UPI002E0F42F4|nr:peptidoglycan-binding protein [Streptomyces phaeochromogenes]